MMEDAQTILVDDLRLIVLNNMDCGMQIHLTDNTIDMLQKQGFKRKWFGLMYRVGDKHLWVIGGYYNDDKDYC